ncbi:MAG TPA: DUF4215 domain-containing protein [Kofleriaceae bacterium]|nr:DUF4215 domain-containing protein [Kofleriaceae bacterium]
MTAAATTSGCDSAAERCGDGMAQSGEECDDGNLANGDECENDCTLPFCGNDLDDPGEECDDGNHDLGDGCSDSCTIEGQCGNGILDVDEACDDANDVAGDGCRPDCLGFEQCGDGLLDQGAPLEAARLVYLATGCNGESHFTITLDDVVYETPPVADDCSCSPGITTVDLTDPALLAALAEGGELTLSMPEDGTWVAWVKLEIESLHEMSTIILVDATRPPQPHGLNAWHEQYQLCLGSTSRGFTTRVAVKAPLPEACDDGNQIDDATCRGDCGVGYCGDGTLDPGEDCDDGYTIHNADDCPADCTYDLCGDGTSDDGLYDGEECDDGDLDDQDACRNDCTRAECRNGILDIGTESCDDGNLEDGDGCRWDCVSELCGNGDIDPGEVCDNGNAQSGDGCRWDCLGVEECGDGLRDDDEECDDGNDDPDDGCDDCVVNEAGRCSRGEPIAYGNADDDLDGLSDCADPDCAGTPDCVPGAGHIGDACAAHTDCEATMGGPSCWRPTSFEVAVCGGRCDPEVPDCGTGGRCVGTTTGWCYPACAEPADCQFGWACVEVLGQMVCRPESTAHYPVEPHL